MLTDRNKFKTKWNVISVLLLLWSVNLFIQDVESSTTIFIKLSWIDLLLINFGDVLSRNFYQHHSFYNFLMSLPRKNKVTYYKPDRSSSTLCCRLRIHGCSDSRLCFAISVPQDNYNVQEKQKAMILFFSVVEFNIFSAALTSSL